MKLIKYEGKAGPARFKITSYNTTYNTKKYG